MSAPIHLPLCAVAYAAALLSLPAFAAGLGELTLRSHLGQPLQADIELVAVDAAERESLRARLASVEAHQRANVEFAPALQSLRVTLGRRPGGQPFVRIVSHSPVNEPFLRFLLELGTDGGQITREYTVLLDPPGTARGPAIELPAAATGGAVGGNDRRVPRATRTDRRDPAGEVSTPGLYLVQPGDSLSQIALEQRPEGVSLQRMMAALHRANQGAFLEGNIDRLVAGRTLRMPTAEELQAVERTDSGRAPRPTSGASVAGAVPARLEAIAPRQIPTVDDARAAPDIEIRSSRLERLEPPLKPPARPRDRLTLAPPPAAAPDPGAEAAERLVQRQRARVFELENRMDELLHTLKQANERIAQLNRELDTMAARRSAAPGTEASPRPAEAANVPRDASIPGRPTASIAHTAVPGDAQVAKAPDRAAPGASNPPAITAPAIVPPSLVLAGAAAPEADPALRTFADRARGRLVPIVGSLFVLLGVLMLAVRWWLRSRVSAADEGAVYSGTAVEEMLSSRKDDDHWQPLAPDSADAMVTTEVDLNIGEAAHLRNIEASPVPPEHPAPDPAGEEKLPNGLSEGSDAAVQSPLASWSARLVSARRGAASGRRRSSRA